MTNPIEAWHADHAYFSRLLELLRKELDAFHLGRVPNYELMLDIISYLRDYSDEMHHPREDVAFARMVAYCPDLELLLACLAQEHRVIAHAGERLRTYLVAILADTIVPRDEVEISAATYLVYYGNHIATEEKDVLPRAAEVLTPVDWEAVGKAVPHRSDPLFGGSDELYKFLRHQIALES